MSTDLNLSLLVWSSILMLRLKPRKVSNANMSPTTKLSEKSGATKEGKHFHPITRLAPSFTHFQRRFFVNLQRAIEYF